MPKINYLMKIWSNISTIFKIRSRDIRRFILNPSHSDVLFFCILLIIISLAMTIITSNIISTAKFKAETYLYFTADKNFCNKLLEKANYEGILCKVDVSNNGGQLVSKFTLLGDDKKTVGEMALLVSHGFSIQIAAKDSSAESGEPNFILIANEDIISRFPLLWRTGLFSTTVNAKTHSYEGIFAAALKEISKESDARWTDSQVERLASKINREYLKEFVPKAYAVENSSSYTSTMPLVIYFFAWLGFFGYLVIGLGSLYVQKYMGDRIPDSMDKRLRNFDYIIDALAPLGLVGTVLGMIHAIQSFGRQNDSNQVIALLASAQLDTGLGLALYTTLLGITINLLLRIFVCHPFDLYAFHRQTKIYGYNVGGGKNS